QLEDECSSDPSRAYWQGGQASTSFVSAKERDTPPPGGASPRTGVRDRRRQALRGVPDRAAPLRLHVFVRRSPSAGDDLVSPGRPDAPQAPFAERLPGRGPGRGRQTALLRNGPPRRRARAPDREDSADLPRR